MCVCVFVCALWGSPRRHGDGGLCVGHRIKAAGGDGGSAADLVRLPTINRSLLFLPGSDLPASGGIESKISLKSGGKRIILEEMKRQCDCKSQLVVSDHGKTS